MLCPKTHFDHEGSPIAGSALQAEGVLDMDWKREAALQTISPFLVQQGFSIVDNITRPHAGLARGLGRGRVASFCQGLQAVVWCLVIWLTPPTRSEGVSL